MRSASTCLSQLQRHPVAADPAVELIAGDRALVGENQLRQAAKLPDPIEHPRHLLARDDMVDQDVDSLLRVVIDDRQALEPLHGAPADLPLS